MTTLLNVAFDETSMAAISHFADFPSVFQTQMGAAMLEIGDLVVQLAQQNTWEVFANPTGDLAESISAQLVSPVEVIITVGVPYGRRLEMGFFGADSLGRVYNEEAKPYAGPALEEAQDQIAVLMGNAMAETFAELGAFAE